MDEKRLRRLLEEVRTGAIELDAAFEQVKQLPFADLGFAQVDHHRALRQGLPEVVLGEPKSAEQIVAIAQQLRKANQNVLVTRLSADKAEQVRAAIPDMSYAALARIGWIQDQPTAQREGNVVVLTAGTSDIPVAEEAAQTLRLIGVEPQCSYDVGVAGIHRLLSRREQIEAADALIVVAGMEGALASVVGGIAACPVIAVPTSIGYGSHLAGFTPLFGMLSSCAAGVVVVNIDNGFGAAMAVHRILVQLSKQRG